MTENTVDQNTVREAFWTELLGGAPSEEEEEMALRSVVRTKVGSAWALANVGSNHIEHYLLCLEADGTARTLNYDALMQELFWLGIDISEVWQVDDVFLQDRYYFVNEASVGPEAASADPAASTMSAAGAGLFAIVLVALLWVGLELGLNAEWYDLTQWQIAAIVGVVVILAAMVAAFVSAQGAAVLRAVRRRQPAPQAP